MGRTKLHDLPQMRQYAKGGHLYARVRFEGQDFFLGRWGSKEARTAYDRLVSNILLRRRPSGTPNAPPPIAAPEATHPAPATIEPPAAPTVVGVGPELLDDLTIAEVGDRYLEHCRNYYRSPTGKRTSSFDNAVQAITALRPFDMLPANGFGPKKLCHIRDAEAAKKRSRVGCNKIVKAVRRLFKWAESQELVRAGLSHALETVDPLKIGRTDAPELPPIEPVDDAVVDATLPYLSEIVADMVRLQRLTGARPGEICGLRPADIDRSEDVWAWKPKQHKTAWRGRARVIMIGPRAQAILKRYLLREDSAYCFSPAESEKQRSRQRRLNRQSPLTPSQRARKPKKNGQRRPGDQYDSASYRRAISRGVHARNAERLKEDPQAVMIEDWAPNRLRHAAATEVRKKFGLEAAQVVLGHSSADITQVYAERDQELAAKVIKQIG
jgi:integrase